MENLKMHTPDLAAENYKKLAALFPNAVTETITGYDEKGKPIVERAIDADVLRQEISAQVVEGPQERYQFTWPDKKKSVVLANQPIAKTLRLDREKSVGRDGTPGSIDTENIYIEGDNLDALKLLQETYLGKVKMIYIDPPYNTGNDFIYEDDFSQKMGEYLSESGQFDEEGNRLVQNTESNGRFHTDWLNMIYPRLRLAKDFLSDDGAVFISIDDNEKDNLKKCCDEVFGEDNYVATFPWRKRTAKSDVPFGVSQDYEWIILYAKTSRYFARVDGKERQYFETTDYPNRPWRIHDLTTQRTASERPNSNFTMINPKNGDQYPANPLRTWAVTRETFDQYYAQGKIVFPGDYEFLNISRPAFRYWKEDDMKKAGETFGLIPASTKLPDDIGMSLDGTKEITTLFDGKFFSYPKTVKLIRYFVEMSTKVDKDCIIMDFFSGSATTAHSILELNAQDRGYRKFIMVQLPERVDPKSEPAKAGYVTICDIGEERIRRAGRKIKGESPLTTADLDIGFRVFRVDTSNMKDVYYRPTEVDQGQMNIFADNIKKDRTPEDLLFQVMLDLGVLLSSKIEETVIAGKKVFSVADGYLIACFDKDVTDETVKAIAQRHPFYAIFRDAGMASDSVMTNFEQIFETYSPRTQRKVL